ncbi:general transcription factor II-I repeat domain-containing protein 2-like [Silurus asotus]|uniref:General transcription factor II-I repeat domain-containing protein 2-like n=1 Tax=Silurus asotus TaxID=30991 RepID=A0AAD5FPQ9_SILAS|nr:general transcription factor II-I repeat domain-containing protein 2-like [Silurus asotus]
MSLKKCVLDNWLGNIENPQSKESILDVSPQRRVLSSDMFNGAQRRPLKVSAKVENLNREPSILWAAATGNKIQRKSFSAEKPAVAFPGEKCVEALEILNAEFGVQFRELHVHAKEIRLFQNPFVADIDEAQPSYQFELAELQNCDVLKDAFKPKSPTDFYAALPNDTYPNIKKHLMKMSTLFGSPYICEQTFSRMKLLKTPTRSRLTDEHLHQCLRLAVTRMEPDIQLLTSQMQAHNSH